MSHRFIVSNETSQPLQGALWGLLKRALSRDYRVLIDLPQKDHMGGRRERTASRRSVEVELFEDGSGVEVAFWGLRCMFGVEERAADVRCAQ